jgi:hypothetical protein
LLKPNAKKAVGGDLSESEIDEGRVTGRPPRDPLCLRRSIGIDCPDPTMRARMSRVPFRAVECCVLRSAGREKERLIIHQARAASCCTHSAINSYPSVYVSYSDQQTRQIQLKNTGVMS